MNKSIPERIFVWEDEMNEFLLGKRKQVQIGINQDPVRGLLTYVRNSPVVQSEVDLEEEMTSYIERNFHIRSDETLEVGNDPLTTFDFEKIARHFAKWGAEHLKE